MPLKKGQARGLPYVFQQAATTEQRLYPETIASFQVGLVESARLNGHSICGASTRAAAVAMKLHFSKGDSGRAAAPQSECLSRIE